MKPSHVMICRGDAAGLPCDGTDRFLRSCDHGGCGGIGVVEWTEDLHHAKRFDEVVEALDFLGMVPDNHPLRDDGEPNRPLMAFDWEIVPVPCYVTESGLTIACQGCGSKRGWETVTDYGTVQAPCEVCGGLDGGVAVVRITKALLRGVLRGGIAHDR